MGFAQPAVVQGIQAQADMRFVDRRVGLDTANHKGFAALVLIARAVFWIVKRVHEYTF